MNDLKTVSATATSFLSKLGLQPIWSTKNTQGQVPTRGLGAEGIVNENFLLLETTLEDNKEVLLEANAIVDNRISNVANLSSGGINTYGSLFTDGTAVNLDYWSIISNTISVSRKFVKAQVRCLSAGGVRMVVVNESTLSVVAQKNFSTLAGQVLTITPVDFPEFNFAGNTQRLGIYFQNIDNTNRVLMYKDGITGNNTKAFTATGATYILYRPYLLSVTLTFEETTHEVVSGSLFTDSSSGIDNNLWSITDNLITAEHKFVKAQVQSLSAGGIRMLLIDEDTLAVVAQKNFTTVAGQRLTVTASTFSEFDFANNTRTLGIYFQNVDTQSRAIVYQNGIGNNSKVIPSTGATGVLYRTFILSLIIITEQPASTLIVREVLALDQRVRVLETGASDFNIYDAVANHQDIKLPPGVINLTRTLVIPSNRKITGVRGATQLKAAPGVIKAMDITNASDIELGSFTLVGNDPDINTDSTTVSTKDDVLNEIGIGENNGIYITGNSDRVSVDGVHVRNFNGSGIWVLATNDDNKNGNRISAWVSNCYKGIKIDRRAEYMSVINTRISDCIIGASCAAGNVLWNNVSTPRNRHNFALMGAGFNALFENDGHSTITGCDFNHSKVYSLIISGITNGEILHGIQLFDGMLYIENSKGIVINASQLAATSIDVLGATTALISNSVFFKNYGATDPNHPDITTKLLLKNNFYVDGSDSDLINN